VAGNNSAIGTTTQQNGLTGSAALAAAFTNSNFVSLPANFGALGASAAPSFALSLFSPLANRFLNLELSALEADGKGKVISSPRVITSDQKKATISQGTRVPYQQATSSGATSTVFVDATLKLEVTPHITPDGSVIMTLEISKDSVGTVFAAGVSIDTKRVDTEVLVENGGTVVIGGIFTTVETNDVSKVPLLGDLPIVGALFRNSTKVANKTELLIFITPKIVTDRTAVR
jgi:type IV pilus assembly protein PilQ